MRVSLYIPKRSEGACNHQTLWARGEGAVLQTTISEERSRGGLLLNSVPTELRNYRVPSLRFGMFRKSKKAAEAAFSDLETRISRSRFAGGCRDETASESFYVLCLQALGPFGHGELNCLAFLQAAISIGLNRREVHKYIFPVLTRDKAKAFSGVEPLNCSLFHCFVFPILI